MPLNFDPNDKAPGIYAALGGNEMLFWMVRAAERTAAGSAQLAGETAGLLAKGYGPGPDTLWNSACALCSSLGQLLARLDVVLAASEYPRAGIWGRTVQDDYERELNRLLQMAEQRGLSPDYSAAPERQARFRAAGLHRPGFLETDSLERSFPNEKSDL